MSHRLLTLLVLITLLNGCVTQQKKPTIERIPFPENEYTKLQNEGTSIVKGQAFLKTRGGDVKLAAGEQIVLNPVTSYSNQWYEENYLKQNFMSPADSRLWKYVKKTTADGSGRFKFKNVPAGEYYVTTKVMWETATGYQGSLQLQGGWLTKKVHISNGQEIEIILTK